MSNIKYLRRLELAVLANTHRPKPEEMKEIKVHKKIMTSLKLEGDSKMGMILFVGIADVEMVPRNEIMDYLGLEFTGEFNHKLEEFDRYAKMPEIPIGDKGKMGNRTINKIKLINNHLKLN